VIDQVDDISITSLDLRVAEGKEDDEISKLARTFNNMLERLETAFKMQKNFIANASHELRTPLTTITGQLEVALMNTRTIAEYEQIMHSVLEDIKNLNTASNRLLLLAQASSETSEVDFRPVRVDDVIWQGAAELRKRNPDYAISVSLDDAFKDEEQLIILGNEQLIKTALVNLMDNGCKYSENNQVRISIYPRGKQLILDFTDQGIGIEANDIPHIFEPFYRGKNTVSIRGHGIGLSLVERIIHLHRGQIQVFSLLEKGSTFEITFPVYHF
jgi:signal transduction histidine kinase